MKILQVCHKPPFGSEDGGILAEKAFCQLLIDNNFEVDILTIATTKHPFNANKTPEWFNKQGSIDSVFIDTKISITKAFINLFTKSSFVLDRFKSKQLENLIQNQSEKYDLVVFDGLSSATMLLESDLKKCKGVLRSHNIEHRIWKKAAFQCITPIKAFYLNIQADRMKTEELNIMQKVDAVWHISADEINESDFLKKSNSNLNYVPFTFPVSKQSETLFNKEMLNFGFLGSFNWLPNQEALKFIKSLSDKTYLKQSFKYIVAGRYQSGMDRAHRIPNFKNMGKVDSINHFFNEINVFINPIFSGSGIRIKLFDAISNQKPIISTKLGIEGFGLTPNVHYIEAETESDFIEAMTFATNNNQKMKDMARLAFNHIENKFSTKNGLTKLNIALNNLL